MSAPASPKLRRSEGGQGVPIPSSTYAGRLAEDLTLAFTRRVFRRTRPELLTGHQLAAGADAPCLPVALFLPFRCTVGAPGLARSLPGTPSVLCALDGCPMNANRRGCQIPSSLAVAPSTESASAINTTTTATGGEGLQGNRSDHSSAGRLERFAHQFFLREPMADSQTNSPRDGSRDTSPYQTAAVTPLCNGVGAERVLVGSEVPPKPAG